MIEAELDELRAIFEAERFAADEAAKLGPTLLPAPYGPLAGLWAYGPLKLLSRKRGCVEGALAPKKDHTPAELDAIEKEAEELALSGAIIVTGLRGPAAQRAALVPLRWGAPRIVVFPGGFYESLGRDLKDEPFRAARLWRYQWDETTDLAISRRPPEARGWNGFYNPTVDKLVRLICAE